jgi:uncharacterized membrane protein
MSERPMFFFAGVYGDVEDAEADYEAIKALHAGDMIGSYDSAIISKDESGKVKVDKTEKPTQHGGWAGLAAGAAVAVAAPVAMPVLVAAGGAGLGAWIGHLARGMSRKDAKELGGMLDEGTAALVVIGVDKDAERVEKTVSRATKYACRRIEADAEEAEEEALAVMASA